VWIYTAPEAPIGFPTGHWTNFAMMIFVAVASIALAKFYHIKNAKILKESEDSGMEARLFTY